MVNPKLLLCVSLFCDIWMWILFVLCAGKPNGVPVHVAWLPCYHHNVCCYWGSCSQDASWVSCGLAKGAFAFSEVQVAAKYTQSLSASRLSRNSSRGNDVQERLIVRRRHEYKLRLIAFEPWWTQMIWRVPKVGLTKHKCRAYRNEIRTIRRTRIIRSVFEHWRNLRWPMES
jgi:hypothetical protein